MNLCEGTRKHPHAPIVHEEGFSSCPLCTITRQLEDIEEQLAEAADQTERWLAEQERAAE